MQICVNYRSSISKSILIVPHNFFNIWFNFSHYDIQQNFVSCISQYYSHVILTPISGSSFMYRNYYGFFPFFRYPFLLPICLTSSYILFSSLFPPYCINSGYILSVPAALLFFKFLIYWFYYIFHVCIFLIRNYFVSVSSFMVILLLLLPSSFINHISLAFFISSIANLHSSSYHLFLYASVLSSFSISCCLVSLIVLMFPHFLLILLSILSSSSKFSSISN